MLTVEDKALQTQVERILHSDEFRTSEVLRRLLKFLAEKTAAGEADHLQEYAVDGLGKHPSYMTALVVCPIRGGTPQYA
jgi:hypothetical protein